MRPEAAAALVLAAVLAGGCARTMPVPPAPADAARSADAGAVRDFIGRVAREVSRDGPIAWKRAFQDGPQFFMASDGMLVFGDGAAMRSGVEALTHTLPQIELNFGEDLRVDPLTPTLASVGASYRELQTDAQGRRHEDHGYFTALAELRDGAWTLRNAHWSSVPASAPDSEGSAGRPAN